MDPRIILAGQLPDTVGAMGRGTALAAAQNEVGQRNALASLYASQGPGIMSGDPQALNALSRIDPFAGQEVQSNRLGMDATRQDMAYSTERMQMDRDEAKRRTAAALAEQQGALDAAEVARLRQEGIAELAGVTQAWKAGPEAYAAWAAQDEDWAGVPYEQAAPVIAQTAGALDALSEIDLTMPEAPKPMTDMGKAAADARNGYITPDQVPAAGVGTPLVQINPEGNSGAFNKKADENAAARFDTIVSDGVAAERMVGDLMTLAEIAKGLETGLPAQLMNALGPYAEGLGVEVEGLGAAQAYDAIIARLAPAMRTPGAGASSDFDAKQFLKGLPALGKTPEGNAIISATLQSIQQHKIAAAEIARKAFNGEITWQEGDKQIAALGNPFDAFNKFKGKGATAGSGGMSQDDIDFMMGGQP